MSVVFKERSYDLIIDLRGERREIPRVQYLASRLGVRKLSFPEIFFSKEEKVKILKDFPFLKERKVKIAVSPGSGWECKKWQREKWVNLVEILKRKYSALIIEMGKNEKSLNLGINLVDKTSLREAAGVLSECNLFIGCDSGLMHLALAVNTPTIALFGPTAPEIIVGKRQNFYPVKSPLSCQGCWNKGIMKHPDTCPYGVAECMRKIKVEEIVNILRNLSF